MIILHKISGAVSFWTLLHWLHQRKARFDLSQFSLSIIAEVKYQIS